MKRHIIAVSLVVLVSTTGAIAQVHNHPEPSDGSGVAQKNIRLPSPAEWARIKEAHRLGDAARAALNAGDYLEAETDARQAVADGERSGFSDETLASSLYSQGKEQEAFQAYKKIADTGGSFPRNLLPYALLSVKAGHWAQAAWAYDKALPHLDFGDLMRQQGGFSPDVPQPTDLEADIHISMGLTMNGADFHGTYQERSQQALAHFQQALALKPNSALTNYYYGYGLRRLGHHAEAQAAFRKAAALGQGGIKTAAEKELR